MNDHDTAVIFNSDKVHPQQTAVKSPFREELQIWEQIRILDDAPIPLLRERLPGDHVVPLHATLTPNARSVRTRFAPYADRGRGGRETKIEMRAQAETRKGVGRDGSWSQSPSRIAEDAGPRRRKPPSLGSREDQIGTKSNRRMKDAPSLLGSVAGFLIRIAAFEIHARAGSNADRGEARKVEREERSEDGGKFSQTVKNSRRTQYVPVSALHIIPMHMDVQSPSPRRKTEASAQMSAWVRHTPKMTPFSSSKSPKTSSVLLAVRERAS
ncbi:hypothetical protein B0H13DRAFT_1864773 [Mycena leptocephala]|nr:hypothetical protein B0H13DRAFT_1864773 [Mycena leptocephala]